MRKQRPGTFKTGHQKLGGRKKGTPNRVNQDLLDRIVRAAGQVGSDGKGKDGVDGWLRRLAGRKEGYFVGLFRHAVQKQVTASEPENEAVPAINQDFRQALLDRGLHPTLLPPSPRDFNEKPPVNYNLVPPKPPPGWGWLLIRTGEAAEIETELPDPAVEGDPTERADEPNSSQQVVESSSMRQEELPPPLPAPTFGYKYGYNPDIKAWVSYPREPSPWEKFN